MAYYKDIKCGTYSGYQRHYRNKEVACDPCKKAASDYSRQWQKRNIEKFREYRRNSAQRKAAKHRQKVRRRARVRGNEYERYTFEQVIELYGTICYLCNLEIDMEAPRNCIGDNWQNGLHIDHVIPISKNGPDTLENVRPTHALCNINKSSGNAEKAPTQD